jgi:hypothetical protein
MHYNSAVLKPIITTLLLLGVYVDAQQSPQVHVTMLNVCTPGAEEQKEIAAALARIPAQPKWGKDFEVARGRSSMTGEPGLVQPGIPAQLEVASSISDWARIRREYSGDSPFVNAQYSFSLDSKQMTETLVFRLRDPKDLMQISIQDSMSAVVKPAAALSTDSPASRIRLERLGKSSIVLARCTAADNPGGAAVDQSAYEPLFRRASTVMAGYRKFLGVRTTIPAELARVAAQGSTSSSGAKRPAKSPKH